MFLLGLFIGALIGFLTFAVIVSNKEPIKPKSPPVNWIGEEPIEKYIDDQKKEHPYRCTFDE